MRLMTVSVCIVLFKSDVVVLGKVLRLFSDAALNANRELGVKFNLYLVDNDSGENYLEEVSNLLDSIEEVAHESGGAVALKLIKNDINGGYSGGNNFLLSDLDSDYHIVMNPDVYMFENTLLEAIKYMQSHHEIGLLSPAIYGIDQKQVFLCKKNPTLFDMFLRSYAPRVIKNVFARRMKNFEMHNHDYANEILDVPFLSGCFMFFRTSIYKELNGFDERFFLYMEDADITRRTLRLSRTVYLPQVKVIHLWTRGSHQNTKLMLETVKSSLRYWRKWGGLF